MMDHCWDGFYSCQLRLSRFPIQLVMDDDYIMEFAGTPPGNMRFKLDESEGDGTLIRIKFPESAAYEIYDTEGNKIPETEWNEDIGGPAYLTK